MVSPAQWRTWVRWVQEAFAVAERTACDAGVVARSSVRYASVAAPQEPLRQRLRELAQTRVAYGYRRLHVLLCGEGWPVNHNRMQHLYRDEGRLRHPRTTEGAGGFYPRPRVRGDTVLMGGLRIIPLVSIHAPA